MRDQAKKGGIARHWPALLLGTVVVLILVVTIFTYQVNETEVAVVTTFGRVNPAPEAAGLHFRWPYPVEKVFKLDTRSRVFSGTAAGAAEELLTRDAQNIVVSVFIVYRIEDPIVFFERVVDIATAEQRLNDWMRSAKVLTFGKFRFDELINPDPEKMRLDEINREIAAAVAAQAQNIGIKIESAGINALNVPRSITTKIFERMIEERQVKAQGYRSLGIRRAAEIRSEAEQERVRIINAARNEALKIYAEGDAEAAKYYAEFRTNPELAEFLRKMDALRMILPTRTTLVLDTNTPPFDLLRPNALERIGISAEGDDNGAAATE